MTFGFELEAFITKYGKTILRPIGSGIPYDECGWLAEIRSEPHADVMKAVALLQAEIKAVDRKAAEEGLKLVYQPLMELSRDLKVEAARLYDKGRIHYRNLYGHQTHRCSTKFATAALHISLMNEREMKYTHKGTDHTFRYQGFVDYARLIIALDRAFEAEIRKAKRNPGFYEVKHDGRIEYRSLPNDVSLDKVEEVLTRLLPQLT